MILFVQNDARVPPGVFGELLEKWRVPHRSWRPFAGEPAPELAGLAGAVVLGGKMGVQETVRFPFLLEVKRRMGDWLEREVPLLGICLGGQLLAEVSGGKVRLNARGERGLQPITLTQEGRLDPLFRGCPDCFEAFQWHRDSFDLPPGARLLAGSPSCPFQAFRIGKAACGLQFHPEVDGAIVATWSGPFDPQGACRAGFEGGESAHREMASTLLGNFLALAEGPGRQVRLFP